MRLIPSLQPLRVLLGAGGGLGLAALFMGHPSPPPKEIGSLEPVFAAPAERVEVRTLGIGQTLGGILGAHLPANEMSALLMAFQERASARRLSIGTEVMMRFRAEDGWLRGVDVTINADSTIRIGRDDYGWNSGVIVTPLSTDTVFASGRIQGALWTAVVDNPMLTVLPVGDRGNLITALDGVFQWQIDFSRQIQPGDFYRFAYERRVRPDGSTHSGKIVAAELINAGKSFHAIWFDAEDGTRGSYYDLDGKSLRRAFLAKPLEFRRISSRFTNARLHPVLGTWRAHRGVDYAAASGTDVHATADGTVVHRGVSGGYGNMVEIRHRNGFSTRYAHLSRFASGLRVGAVVKQNDVIGYVGMTGLATGPHLHYELLRGGQQVDPLSANLPSGGDPVPTQALERWTREMVDRLALLEVLPGPNGERYASATTQAATSGQPRVR